MQMERSVSVRKQDRTGMKKARNVVQYKEVFDADNRQTELEKERVYMQKSSLKTSRRQADELSQMSPHTPHTHTTPHRPQR